MFSNLGIDSDIIILCLLAMVLILLVLCVYNSIQISSLNTKYRFFMSGKNGKSLENAISRRIDEIDRLMVANANNQDSIREIANKTGIAFQKMGLLRYDAFDETNGQLSFSLCLLDSDDNGFILNSIHNGEGCYVYLKEIINGNSYTKLSYEEEEALERAKGEDEE